MKGIPVPFQSQVVVPCAKKVVHFQDLVKENSKFIQEPVSVLDNISSSPSPPTSTSTLSGGGGFAAVSGNLLPENQETCSNVGVFYPHGRLQEKCVNFIKVEEKCGEVEDWETVMTESGQEQSIIRWIMGDVEDPGLNKKLLHGGGTAEDGELSGVFGTLDQGYLASNSNNNPLGQISNFHQINDKFTDQKIGFFPNPNPPPPPAAPPLFSDHHQQNPYPHIPQFDVKPHKNPTFFIQEQNETLIPPPPKRYNSGSTQSNFQIHQNPSDKTLVSNELRHHSEEIINQLYRAAEMIQTANNPIFAHSILARLNQQLSPIGKPFDRAAFYFKEALQLLIHSLVNNMNPISSNFSLIFKISAYKSFSEVSPIIQFMNFTNNQALLESLHGFDRIHIVDFDIGFGDQWASFMQELSFRKNNNNHNRVPSLKITAFSSPVNDHFELSLTRENLVHFASEMNILFDFEIVNIDVLVSVSWSLPFRGSDNEAVAVNLPISTFSNHQIPLPLVLRYVKSLSPKIVVSLDRGCERTDLPFANHMIQALESYSNLLESLDTLNVNVDVLQKIERFVIQPGVERIVTGRFSFPEKTQHWRSLFLSCGFSPLTFSEFAESQALCVIKRNSGCGFHVERRQSELVLCWRNRELVSASAWRC